MEDFRKQPFWIKVVIFIGGSLLVAIIISVLGLLNQGEKMEEDCAFPFSARINCLNYDVSRNGLELGLQNGRGRDIIVMEVTASSYAIDGGKCTTGEIDTMLPNGKLGAFELKGLDGGGCRYRYTGREMNRYEIEIVYSWDGIENVRKRAFTAKGDLLAGSPP